MGSEVRRMRFCIAKTWIAYWKLGRWQTSSLSLSLALSLSLSLSMSLVPGLFPAEVRAAELRPEVMEAIRQAAEAASAPAVRYPVVPALPVTPPSPPTPPARLGEPPASTPSVPAAPRPPAWVPVSRSQGRLQAADIGLVINTADPYSVAVGEHYIRRRGLSRQQVLRIALPTGSTLTVEEFESLRGRIDQRFGRKTQALALAWAQPYAVGCNSIGGALALGYDAALCDNSCKPSKPSPYFNSPSARPYTDLGLRLSMHLAAPSIEAARALIDRGALADGSLALRDRQPVSVLLLLTPNDPGRGVRAGLYPPAGPMPGLGVNVRVEPALVLPAARRLLMASTGALRLDFPGPLDWVPGGLGDHLTSYGGAIDPGTDRARSWNGSLRARRPATARSASPETICRSFRTLMCSCCTTCRAARRSKPTGRAWPGRSRHCSWASRSRPRSRSPNRRVRPPLRPPPRRPGRTPRPVLNLLSPRPRPGRRCLRPIQRRLRRSHRGRRPGRLSRLAARCQVHRGGCRLT